MDIDVFHDNLELYRVFATGHISRKIAVSNMFNFSKVHICNAMYKVKYKVKPAIEKVAFGALSEGPALVSDDDKVVHVLYSYQPGTQIVSKLP